MSIKVSGGPCISPSELWQTFFHEMQSRVQVPAFKVLASSPETERGNENDEVEKCDDAERPLLYLPCLELAHTWLEHQAA